MKQMLSLLLAVVLAFQFTGCDQAAQQTAEAEQHTSFTIDGSLANADSLIILLDERKDGAWVNIDSGIVEDGKFLLEGSVEHPMLMYVRIFDGDNVEYVSLFVENGQISFEGDMEAIDDAEIGGSVSHDLLARFDEGYNEYYELYDSLYTLQEESEDQTVKDSLAGLIAQVEDDANAYLVKFVEEHRGSQVAAYLALRHLTYEMSYDELRPIVDGIQEELENSKYLDELAVTLAKMEKLMVGRTAPDFSQESPEGEAVSLSSFRGKYVLVDFWASWCGPCRKENPNVVAMYEAFSDDGFEIIGVSLDKDREKWLKAIADDQLTWPHVSDLQGWKNEVADLYNVKAIPSTYLLDPEGRIIARNLRGDALKEKIQELLGTPS